MKHVMIAYFLGDISAKNYQSQFMYVKVIARQSSDILRHGVVLHYALIF